VQLVSIPMPMTHGTACGWRHHRCRCESCHRALLAEAKVAWAARRLRAGAEPASRVPVGRVRAHLAALEAAGWSRRKVAAAAQVAPATLTRVAALSTKRVSRIVATAVLGVEP